MKSLLSVVMAAVFVVGAGLVDRVEARDGRKDDRRGRVERRVEPRVDRRVERRVERRVDRRVDRREVRYLGSRDVVVIRDYYRPHYRAHRGPRYVYVRHGHLPRDWARRMHVVPVHVARSLPALPRGHRRGIIDGHLVVYNSAGLILDLAVLF